MQILRPGDSGQAVLALDQKLLERGVFVPDWERESGTYGPGTVAAVHDFQAKHGLEVDEVVGPLTWAALDAAPDNSPAIETTLDVSHCDPLTAKMLQVADAEYRRPVFEQPMGSNRGGQVDQYLLGHHGDGRWLLDYGEGLDPPQMLGDGRYVGAPWCGRFVLWCVDEACEQLEVPSPLWGWGDLASAAKWLAQGIRHGAKKDEPAPGRVALILTGGHGHVVLVADVEPEGAISTIEGNSGNRVARRVRRPSEFAAYVSITGN